MFQFIGDNNIEAVKKILIADSSLVNIPNKKGVTPLCCAVDHDNVEMVNLLLSFGADVNAPSNKYQETPLMWAIRGARSIEIVEVLITNKTDLEKRNTTGKTALHIAADDRLVQYAELLLKHGADVNALTNNNTIPLHYSARHSYECTKLLIAYGSKINHHSKGYRRPTPLQYAISNSKLEIVKLLVENGANIHSLSDEESVPVLYHAVNFGELEIVKYLLSCGADVNQTNRKGRTPLHCSCKTIEDYEITELLLEHGADVNAIDINGNTPIVNVIHNLNPGDKLRLCIQYGADLTITNKENKAPLDYVIFGDVRTSMLERYQSLPKLTAKYYPIDIKEPADCE